MPDSKAGILTKQFLVNENYRILLFLSENKNSQKYRIKGNDGKLYFLKLFNNSKIYDATFDSGSLLSEIDLLKKLAHPNIVAYKDSGELIIGEKKHPYLVLDFIPGETLAEKISRENILTIYDVKILISGILNGLQYLDNMQEQIIHNEIAPKNIMLDLSGDIPQPKIIGFEYARPLHQPARPFNKEGLDFNYTAPECFNNMYSPQSDLYSVGALMYHLLFGMPPWFNGISNNEIKNLQSDELIPAERKKPLDFPNLENKNIDINDPILRIIKKALHPDTEIRFKSADEFLMALNGEIEIGHANLEIKEIKKKKFTPKKKLKGFDAVAGMEDFKEQLKQDVINVLINSKEYERYGLTIPNGMLLYGPSGCGKTFFAKRFAEEVEFYFIDVKPSDLASSYIYGTQEKIGKMFADARKKAPTIIFLDELDALVPIRAGNLHHAYASDVNEFLAQMSNCSEHGIFIIGATNKPEIIDPAVLRAGRLDKKLYFPLPDHETRKELFELFMKNRPIDPEIDYEKLSRLTEGHVSSDIELLVDEAARKALNLKKDISMEILEDIIKKAKPSVSLPELKKYEAIKAKMESKNSNEPGF